MDRRPTPAGKIASSLDSSDVPRRSWTSAVSTAITTMNGNTSSGARLTLARKMAAITALV